MTLPVGQVFDKVPSDRYHAKSYKKRFKLRVTSLNVGTMRAIANEIVETLARKRNIICVVQETCWKGCSTRMVTSKDCR